MNAYFKGDKNVFVFEPIPKAKRGRKKAVCHFDRIRNGTNEDIVEELEKAIVWARSLTGRQWNAITNSPGGLKAFIRETMERNGENESQT